ncbi:MAG: hypothetical protein ACHQY2_04220 [Candidatus Eremiobacterales bacterium]|jgi:hypothetical protein
MRTISLRPMMGAAVVVGAAGVLAAGLALSPASATVGQGTVDPNAVIKCTDTRPCQTYKNTGLGPGVRGINTNSSPFGSGVIGSATQFGNGVLGQSVSGNGVSGTSQNAAGVTGTGLTFGTFGYSTGSVGVEGQSSNGIGVEGFSSSFWGVEGASSTGVGVIGVSESSSAAIYAAGSTGAAVIATTDAGAPGLVPYFGVNSGGNGADIEGTYIGILGRAPDCSSGSGFPFVATDQNGNNLMYVDCAGDMFIHGGYGTFLRTPGGKVATTFTSQSASPTIEDNGTAHLVGGVATVQLDGAFAQAIDTHKAYQVMLTPDGDTRGLYVASKSPIGFVVREVQGGRGSLDFDYHIYASTVSNSGARMTVMTTAQAASMMPKSPVAHMSFPKVHIDKRRPN